MSHESEIIFNSYFQSIDIWPSYPQTYCNTVVGLVHQFSWKNIKAGLNILHNKIDQKLMVYVLGLGICTWIFKKVAEYYTKQTFGTLLREVDHKVTFVS